MFMISFAVFLFILFFQPFPLEMLDYNERLLYVTGFGAIYFFLAWMILIVFPGLLPVWFKTNDCDSNPPLVPYLILIVLASTAYAFYIRYVGRVPLSIYIMLKIVLVCLLPILILKILYKNKSMETIISILKEQNRLNSLKLKQYESAVSEEEIEIISENKSDRLSLKSRDIVLVKSADNYIEIYYMVNDTVEKKMIRNTLKNIESQFIHHRSLMKCHRTRIVNINYIEEFKRDFSGYYLKMTCFDEKLPVSRQFLGQVKEAMM